VSAFELLENEFVTRNDTVLFQRPKFFHLHAKDGDSYFELGCNGSAKARIHFSHVDGAGAWRSPARGTFAGLSFDDDLKFSELCFFFDKVESLLRSRGVKSLEILPPPQAHGGTAFAQQVYLLRSFGFKIIRCDLNQSLEIDKRSFVERISYGNVKRLRKCEREGLIAHRLPLSELPAVYETLSINRASKGHALSMTLDQLGAMVAAFPEDVILFGCPHGDSLAAAAVCLQLSSSVLYVFYWGDRPGYSTHSPVVAIADEIFRYGQEQGFVMIDAGTSTLDSDANFGLLEFKRGLGFTESLKVVMRKIL
jgi:hypothetical protein